MRILYVEDDPEMASSLQTHLAQKGMVVDLADSIRAAEEALQGNPYRLMLLDRQLPDGDGASFIPRARQIIEGLPVIILTAKIEVADRVAGLDIGADDYLAKPFATEELLARIRAISRRPLSIPLPVLAIGRLEFDFVGREARIAGELLALPRRQLLVLEALALRQGRTVRRESLLESVYGFDEHIQSNALDAHVSKLRRSLAESDACVEIHVMRGIGYLLKEKWPCA